MYDVLQRNHRQNGKTFPMYEWSFMILFKGNNTLCMYLYITFYNGVIYDIIF